MLPECLYWTLPGFIFKPASYCKAYRRLWPVPGISKLGSSRYMRLAGCWVRNLWTTVTTGLCYSLNLGLHSANNNDLHPKMKCKCSTVSGISEEGTWQGDLVSGRVASSSCLQEWTEVQRPWLRKPRGGKVWTVKDLLVRKDLLVLRVHGLHSWGTGSKRLSVHRLWSQDPRMVPQGPTTNREYSAQAIQRVAYTEPQRATCIMPNTTPSAIHLPHQLKTKEGLLNGYPGLVLGGGCMAGAKLALYN